MRLLNASCLYTALIRRRETNEFFIPSVPQIKNIFTSSFIKPTFLAPPEAMSLPGRLACTYKKEKEKKLAAGAEPSEWSLTGCHSNNSITTHALHSPTTELVGAGTKSNNSIYGNNLLSPHTVMTN